MINGMTLTSTGIFSGTPTTTGTFFSQVGVTDSASPSQSTSKLIVWSVVPATPPPPPGSTLLCDNFNGNPVTQQAGGPPNPTTCTLPSTTQITQLATYHYNNGAGAAPGTISLQQIGGQTFGPFTATGVAGQSGPNEAWVATPNTIVPAGTYTVIDSDPTTWSYDTGSNNAGFARVWGSAVTVGTLTFVTQPTNSTVGKPISPAVQVQAQDSTGALLPGILVTLSIGNPGVGPGGGSLFGTTTATTDSNARATFGIATFSNLVVDNAGTGYTLLASANGVSAASNAFSLTNPATIDFENYPNGNPACANCQVSTDFNNFGVVFSGAAFLLDTGVYDPPNAPPNHAVEKASGTMTMSFPGLPTSVQYQSTQNNSCNVPIQAFDAANNPLAVSVLNSSTYTSTGGSLFRRERVVITNASGIASVSLNDPICAVFVDNLTFITPQPPIGLTDAVNSSGTGAPASVTLSWSSSMSTVIGYNVYRSTTSGTGYAKLNPAAVVATTSFIDTTVAGATTYYYVVTAVNASNVESIFSNEVSAPIP